MFAFVCDVDEDDIDDDEELDPEEVLSLEVVVVEVESSLASSDDESRVVLLEEEPPDDADVVDLGLSQASCCILTLLVSTVAFISSGAAKRAGCEESN